MSHFPLLFFFLSFFLFFPSAVFFPPKKNRFSRCRRRLVGTPGSRGSSSSSQSQSQFQSQFQLFKFQFQFNIYILSAWWPLDSTVCLIRQLLPLPPRGGCGKQANKKHTLPPRCSCDSHLTRVVPSDSVASFSSLGSPLCERLFSS